MFRPWSPADADRYVGKQGRHTLEADLRQHLPIDGERIALEEYIENEAYEPRFIQAPMTYISDSLMVWRQATPHDLLDGGVSFQFLTYPDTWTANYFNVHLRTNDMTYLAFRLALEMPLTVGQNLRRKYARTLHSLSDHYLRQGQLGRSWRYHLQSLAQPGGAWLYGAYTRKRVATAIGLNLFNGRPRSLA